MRWRSRVPSFPRVGLGRCRRQRGRWKWCRWRGSSSVFVPLRRPCAEVFLGEAALISGNCVACNFQRTRYIGCGRNVAVGLSNLEKPQVLRYLMVSISSIPKSDQVWTYPMLQLKVCCLDSTLPTEPVQHMVAHANQAVQIRLVQTESMPWTHRRVAMLLALLPYMMFPQSQ